jgi:hypothetical protein
MVLAKEREQRTVAADILNAHGADFVGFYGRWAWEGLTADEPSTVDTDATQTMHAAASRADEIPSLFVQAWNSRDADALASLFDENAEFVNVTGLWWHDRDSIRRAHAVRARTNFQRVDAVDHGDPRQDAVRTMWALCMPE